MLAVMVGLWWHEAMKTPVVHIPTPILPNPNAFDVYIKASNAVTGDKQISDANSTKPTVAYTLAQKEALVQQNINVIDTLHQGFAYPYFNPPVRSFNTLLPYYAKFRGMARLLSLQGKVRAAHGDWNGAVESDLDAIRLGKDVPHGSVMIGYLVGVACEAIGRRPLWSTVDQLNGTQSRAAVTRLESIMAGNYSYVDTLQQEKYCGQAGLLELFDDPKARAAFFTDPDAKPGDEQATAASASTLSALFFLAYSKRRIMNNYTSWMNRSSELARKPYGLHLPPPALPNDPYNSAVLPVFTDSRLKGVESDTQNGLLLLMLALHAFQLEHGRYPAGLKELAPVYLKRLPDDPFAAQGTFKYRLDGKSYVLYSIGPDGQDDGGKPIDDVTKATSASPNARYFVTQHSIGDVVAGKNIY